MARVVTGLEVLRQAPPAWAKRARLGLLSHPAAVGPDLASARELLAARFPGQLQVLFSPQHGLLGEKQVEDTTRPPGMSARRAPCSSKTGMVTAESLTAWDR